MVGEVLFWGVRIGISQVFLILDGLGLGVGSLSVDMKRFLCIPYSIFSKGSEGADIAKELVYILNSTTRDVNICTGRKSKRQNSHHKIKTKSLGTHSYLNDSSNKDPKRDIRDLLRF